MLLSTELRFALRSLRKQPGFTTVSVLTLAIGIGASTAVFSVVDATLLRPLPFRHTDSLMQVSAVIPAMFGHQQRDVAWSFPKYQTLRGLETPFEDFAAYNAYLRLKLSAGGDPELLNGEYAEAGYFRLLGIAPRYGRTFLPEEDKLGGTQSVVLAHALWRRAFGADPAILGKVIRIGERSFTVIGVMDAGFRGLSGRAEYWLPATAATENQLKPGNHVWHVVARRKAGITEAQAKAAMAHLGAQVDAAFPDKYTGKKWGASAQSMAEVRADAAVRKTALVFSGAVAFLLLVACANVMNLLLARSAARRREIAIRVAVGGSRGRIMRQLLVESAMLAVAGGLSGLLLASWAVRLLASLNTAGENPLLQTLSGFTRVGLNTVAIDARALVFSLAAAAITCLISGLAPAFRASRPNLVQELKAGGLRAGHAGWFGGTRPVVIAEVALAVVLVAGASLMIRSFGRMLAIDTGVDADNVLTVRVDTGSKGARADAFFSEVQARTAALPGVKAVAARDSYPLSSCCSTTTAWLPGRPTAERASDPLVGVYAASEEYFRTMRIRLVRGRLFTSADRPESARVIVIGESAARMFWPGAEPLGKRLFAGDHGLQEGGEVIGVVANVRNRRIEERELPSVYIAAAQAPGRLNTLFIRTTADPGSLAPVVRQVIREVDPNIAIVDMKTMWERISDAGSKARLGATLLAIFASIALALAAVGVYGVMSYSVARRAREMGIRVALGARPASVAALVLWHGVGMTVAGLAIGIPAALALTRVMSSLLYEVRASDALSYILTSAVLVITAVAACWAPARRAASMDAMAVLRAE